MKSSKKISQPGKFAKGMECRLLQEVLVLNITNSEGKPSYSEVSYLCLN